MSKREESSRSYKFAKKDLVLSKLSNGTVSRVYACASPLEPHCDIASSEVFGRQLSPQKSVMAFVSYKISIAESRPFDAVRQET
jgi:hypothetical protein